MKRPLFGATRLAAFTIPAAVMIVAVPVAQAQTDIEGNCASSGGQYTSQQVQPHWGATPSLIETCCTGTGASQQCVTYKDGVQGPTYGGG